MGLILNIETSSENCSVSIANQGNCISLVEENINKYNHDEKIHTFIKYALEGAKIKFFELNAICIDKGPGSYTGIRIGSTVAKALCYALNIPMISIDSLSIMVQKLSIINNNDNYLIIPIIDAKSEVYTAVFNSNHKMITPISKIILNKDSFKEYYKKKIYIIGNGIKKAKEILKINFEYFSVYYPSAEGMIKISNKIFQKKNFEDINDFNPIYLNDDNTYKSL